MRQFKNLKTLVLGTSDQGVSQEAQYFCLTNVLYRQSGGFPFLPLFFHHLSSPSTICIPLFILTEDRME